MAGTRTQVTELYVATFMRAPDAPGIDYWVASPLTIEQVAQSFFDQPETQALYGGTITDYPTFVKAIYNNMFNHGPDGPGEAYWVDELQSGRITPGNMILAIANGALGTDNDILTNKTLVGLDFADSGLSDYTQSVQIMSGITADPATVAAAAAQIQIWDGTASPDVFTTGVDALPGTGGDDVFTGVVDGTNAANSDTYQAFDSATGGAGNDTLHITSSITQDRFAGAATITSVETLHITQNSNNVVGVNAVNFDNQITNLVVDGSATATGGVLIGAIAAGTNLDAVLGNITLSGTNAGLIVTVGYEAGVVAGANSSAVTLTNSVDQELGTIGIETYTVHTGTGSQTLHIVDPDNTTINVDGGAHLTLTSNTATTVNAYAAAGSINTNNAGASTVAAATDIRGGQGNDNIVAAVAGSVSGNGGADQLTSSGAGTAFTYSSQSDSTATGMDTISGFVGGTDNIILTNAIIASGGTPTYVSATTTSVGGSLAEGASFGGTVGTTNIYADTTSVILYADINQDNVFHAADDLVIDFSGWGGLLWADIIV